MTIEIMEQRDLAVQALKEISLAQGAFKTNKEEFQKSVILNMQNIAAETLTKLGIPTESLTED